MSVILLVGLAFFPVTSSANAISIDGSGSELAVIHNDNARVVHEQLDISPLSLPRCYQILFRGKQVSLQKFETINIQTIRDIYHKPEMAQIGDLTDCPELKPFPDATVWNKKKEALFVPTWHAKVKYTIESAREHSIELAFPVQKIYVLHPLAIEKDFFKNEAIEANINAPGVTNFQVQLDGQTIPVHGRFLKKGEFEKFTDSTSEWDVKQEYVLTWKINLPAGPHALDVNYDFPHTGLAEMEHFCEITNPECWPFHTKNIAARINERHAKNDPADIGKQINYFLTPLKTWGKTPPDSVTVKINFPKVIPTTHVIPYPNHRYTEFPNLHDYDKEPGGENERIERWKIDTQRFLNKLPPIMPMTCVDTSSVVFQFQKQYPTDDLELWFMNVPDRMIPLKKLTLWRIWRQRTGFPAITCGLRDEIAITAENALKAELKLQKCIETCK